MKAASYRPEDIRNVVLLGQPGAGKTLLAEALLHRTGAITRMGSVEAETTTSDFEPEARAHHHSTSSSVLFATHQGKELNLIDTPGHPELVGATLASLSAVETALVVVNANAGVEHGTRRLFHAAGEAGLARMLVVNKVDAAPQRLEERLAELKAVFGPKVHAINLPAPGLTDVVDCFEREAGATAFGSVQEAHRELVESVVEVDDAELERYLAGEHLSPDELRRTVVAAMAQGHLVPVLFTSARTGLGLEDLLHVVAEEAPSPVTGRKRRLRRAGELVEVPCTVEAPFLGQIFKVTTDPHLGQLAMLRVLQGRLTAHTQFTSPADARVRKAGHLLKVEGRDHPELEAEAFAGDLVALGRMEGLAVDQLLHAPEVPGPLEAPRDPYPTPMLSLAVAAANRQEEVKLGAALQHLTAEDPTFTATTDPVTHELVLSGLGEVHLNLQLERLANRHKLKVSARAPSIPFRETASLGAEGHHRHRKQTGGAGQFAEVFLRVEPLPRGSGVQFASEVFGGAIPLHFMGSVEKGVQDALSRGNLAGYPVHDVRVVVTDGKTHPVDSKDIAFRTAARYAVRDALGRARCLLLEPVVSLEVTTPESAVGAVLADLKSLRGRVMGVETLPGALSVVRALAPLAELKDYASRLRGATGGQGTYLLELAQYEPVPAQLHASLVESRKAHREADADEG